jgi:putative IMPACT (imprinted ancient) family translation regulator
MEMTYVTHSENVPYLKAEGIKILRQIEFDKLSEITIFVTRQTLIEIYYAGVKAGIDRKF